MFCKLKDEYVYSDYIVYLIFKCTFFFTLITKSAYVFFFCFSLITCFFVSKEKTNNDKIITANLCLKEKRKKKRFAVMINKQKSTTAKIIRELQIRI